MALNLEAKKAIVAEVSEVASRSISLVVAENLGLSVSAMTELRSKARAENVYLRVVRNTLARKALKDTDFHCIDDALVGPLVYGFSEEPSAAARLFKDFAKGRDAFQVKALTVAGQLYPANQLDAVAALPTRLEAFGILAATLMAAATRLVRTIAEPHSRLVRALDDLSRKKS